jgi:hypothetical protein
MINMTNMTNMTVTIIGLLHTIHSPLLVLFPFIVKNFTADIFYIIYFFSIMFFYTFINGECPISYLCKVMLDTTYIAGSNIYYYPEMEYVILNKQFIKYYFGTMTVLYMLTLFFVIFRSKTFYYFFIVVFAILLNYFLLLHFHLNNGNNDPKQKKYFLLFQEITKCTLFFTICLLFLCNYAIMQWQLKLHCPCNILGQQAIW